MGQIDRDTACVVVFVKGEHRAKTSFQLTRGLWSSQG